MLAFLNRHKTKLMGFLITILGAIQAAAPQLSTLLDGKTYATVMVVCGVTVAAIGFFNSHALKAEAAAKATEKAA